MQKELQNRLNFLYYYRSFKNHKKTFHETHSHYHLIAPAPLVVYTRNSWVIIWNWIYLYPDKADYITQAVIINYCDQRDGCHSDIRIW